MTESMMEKIAVTGLACLFPGATTPEAFWRLLDAGQRATWDATPQQIGADPVMFYDADRSKPDTSYFLHGGYIRDFTFDPNGFRLPASMLSHLDESDQWTLYVARGALADSGNLHKPDILARTGLILGNLAFPMRRSTRLFSPIYDAVFETAWRDLLGDARLTLSRPDAQAALHPPYDETFSPGYPAALAAAALGLGGTHFALDAACGSSLYAVGLACAYLASGKADLMLAGAVSAADPLFVNMGFAHLGGYPEAGKHSLPLDAGSDGLIASEGAGMFVLKRYADALRDGDHIYALIGGVGLSNDGRGKHILTPNNKGQTLALQRAHISAGITPGMLDYVEGHASGTVLGDRTELASMRQFYEGLPLPLMGSVKSNVGHLLTAAGMASMTKIILSLAHSKIPKTPYLQNPLEPDFPLTDQPYEWKATGQPRRAGVNAFGFGGVSAHVIMEEHMTNVSASAPGTPPQRQHIRMAITGMDAHFGSLEGLDAFARSIYDGDTAFTDLPEHRWKGLQHHPQVLRRFGLDSVPQGAYIGTFDVDFMKYRIPPHPSDEPIPQQLILLKVADNAVRDAGLQEGANVAVLVALGTELALHRYRGRVDLNWQVEQALADAGVTLDAEQIEELRRITKDALLTPAQVNHYTSYIGNITASRVSALWDFSGPAFTVSSEENSVFKALETAQLLLASGDVDAVVIGAVDLAASLEGVLMRNQISPLHQGTPTAGIDQKSTGWMIGEGAGAVVLRRADDVQDAYAVIESVAFAQDNESFPAPPSGEAVRQAAQAALTTAGISAAQVEYVEFHASGVPAEDAAEISGLTAVYRGDSPETALGTVKANIGHTFAASGMASLIKSALCVGQRFLPAVPNWDAPEHPDAWNGSAFWVAGKSRTWFSDRRYAAVNSLGADGVAAHVVLSDVGVQARQNDSIAYLRGGSPHLLPVSGSTEAILQNKLNDLYTMLDSESLAVVVDRAFADYQAAPDAAYTLTLVGRSSDEIRPQIEQARRGISTALANGGTWATPAGSYFTARPVGKSGKVAFVYPGAFNSYPKMGYELFHLFPSIYDSLHQIRSDMAEAVSERMLYPRTLEKAGPRVTRQLKADFSENVTDMIESGLSFALLYTRVMIDAFGLQPHSAFGYSLGEGSMMWGMGVWRDGDGGSKTLRSTTLFRERLVGPMNAVREAWGVPANVPTDDLWAAYFLAAPVDAVQQAADRESRVYLTHINTPNEVMIAGDPAACQRVIDSLGVEGMRAPFTVSIHNEAMLSEYAEFRRLHDLPVHPVAGVTFYSAADYVPIKLDQTVIANSIARMTCKQINFPRLIERAYADGARVFVELGPRSTCARWVSETLGERDHVAVSIDNLGTDSRTSVIRMLAQLISHRVPLDLAALYRPLDDAQDAKSLVRTVRLGGQDIYTAIVNDESRAKFADVAPAASESPVGTRQAASISQSPRTATPLPADIHRVHADFLKSRQDALRQMGEMIQAQMASLQGGVQPAVPAMPTPPESISTLPPIPAPNPNTAPSVRQGITPMYGFDMVNTFALGRVADCFGELYAIYDNVRAPRIPNGDLLLVTRAVNIEGERFKTRPGTAIHSEYEVPADAWFYRDNPYPVMPYSVYMEIALQPCGFLSAYHGPTLEFPDVDFYFRNLDGYGTLHRDVDMRGRTITNHVTLLRSTVLQGTIIQSFSYFLYDEGELFYEGEATFGYFTKEALSSQAGLDAGKRAPRWIDTVTLDPSQVRVVDPHSDYGEGYLKLGRGMLEFTDEIKVVPGGGVHGEGYAYANTVIDPSAWFFKAHFHQDPVMPGSIGVETIMQAMQAFAIETGLGADFQHPRFAQTGGSHTIIWKYRGQILSDSEKSHVEANIKRIERTDGQLTIYADASLWRDTLRIYEVKDIALSIVEA